MKSPSSLNQVVTAALLSIAVISVAAVGSDYQGRVDFSLSSNGIKFVIGGGKQSPQ